MTSTPKTSTLAAYPLKTADGGAGSLLWNYVEKNQKPRVGEPLAKGKTHGEDAYACRNGFSCDLHGSINPTSRIGTAH